MREIEFHTDGRRWRADLAAPLDLAIPLRAGSFTVDVRQRASCPCGVSSPAPHCHGRHSERAVHLTIGGERIAAHRIDWGLPIGERDPQIAERGRALVTELACRPPSVPDGLHLLDLHVPAFSADAAPSRPVLYPVHEAAT